MKPYHGIQPVFDDDNLVSDAGLVPFLELAENARLSELVEQCSTSEIPNLPAKVRTVVAGMASGADSFDDLNRLRSGGNNKLIEDFRASTTIGFSFRSITNGGHIEQIYKVNRMLLTNLNKIVPNLISNSELVFIDIDDTVREVHGHKKGGAGFGYTKKLGLNAMLATISAPSTNPVIVEASLRKGSTSSGKGAARQLARALSTVNGFLQPEQQRWVRGDSAFCTAENVATVVKAGATFSFTAKAWPTVTAAIAAIPDDAWKAIKYPNAIFDKETGEWISEAEVAEVPFTAFSSKSAHLQYDCRLIIRRVVRKHPLEDTGQGTLFTEYRHHAFITNSKFSAVDADKYHRQHAVIEQVIAELKGNMLAHLPSGSFHANAMWLALAVITFNLMRAAAHASLNPKARFQTIRHRIINIPGRIARTSRKKILHLPTHWPWAIGWQNLWQTISNPPLPA